MTAAADFIQVLLRRTQLQAHRLPAPGEFPAGWQRWFATMRERVGAITGATAVAIVDVMVQRPLASPPPRVRDLSRWEAFTTLWRQDWQPAPRDDRRMRWVAAGVSALWHVLFGAMLLWLMYLQYLHNMAPPPEGEAVVQIEYVGVGTPAEAGGGAAVPTEANEASEPAAAAAAVSSAAPATPSLPALVLPAAVPDVAQREVPEPEIPPPTAEQPVVVSEPTPSEDPVVFVLPPPTPSRLEPRIEVPELQAPAREVSVTDVPEPLQTRQRELPQPVIEAPARPVRVPEVATRDVPAPLPRVRTPELPTPAVRSPELQARAPAVPQRDVPTPAATAPASTAASPTATAAAPAPSASPAATASTAAPAPSSTAAPATAQGTGPRPTPAPGALPSTRRADDWGESTRNRPGAQRGERPGAFNSDGSVRLAETPGSAAPGQPPGTVTQEIAHLDRAGTWLKRPPNDYEPSTFDRYWRPNETLLAEWVRKGIKEVAIPIPGSSKRIVCTVSLLQFGGGCGISDPNLNEQPATARPPPDIPFKPHLQEDNGSVRPQG